MAIDEEQPASRPGRAGSEATEQNGTVAPEDEWKPVGFEALVDCPSDLTNERRQLANRDHMGIGVADRGRQWQGEVAVIGDCDARSR